MALLKTQLFEKMTEAERDAIVSPFTGQTIYNTDTNNLDYWNGGSWKTLSTGSGTSVISVSGTLNRITSTGGTTPVIDIDANYVGQASITTLGTISTGTWQGTVVTGQYGGTGVANTGKTITLGGNLVTSGAFALTLTQTGVTNVTLPTTGTLATIDQAQTISGVNTFLDQTIKLRNPANTFSYVLVHGAIAGNRNLNIPVLTGTDTLAVLGLDQTFTGANTHSGLNAIRVSSSGLTVRNPANTFSYTITAAAIAANRQLNLPLTTATDTLAVLGLAQTFTATQTFNADIVRSGFTAGGNNITTSAQIVAGVNNTNLQTYLTTNGGSTLQAAGFFTSSLTASGTIGVALDKGNGNGIILFAPNASNNKIARAAITLTNLTNTAASEAGDMIFLVQSGGTAMSQKGRISGLGNFVLGAESALATNATDGFAYIPTCAGTPTGVPTAYTGKVAMVYDTTNNKLYVYNGGWKGGTTPGAWT